MPKRRSMMDGIDLSGLDMNFDFSVKKQKSSRASFSKPLEIGFKGIGFSNVGFSSRELDTMKNVGKAQPFEVGFGRNFQDDDLLQNNPRAPELISDNFEDDPFDNDNAENPFDVSDDSENFENMFSDRVPNVLEVLPNIGERRVPMDDEEADRKAFSNRRLIKGRGRRAKFQDLRAKQLLTGTSEPLNEQEVSNIQRGRTATGEIF